MTDTNIMIPDSSLSNGSAQPVQASDRIKTIDMIRGLALLGILLMNIPYFSGDGVVMYDAMMGDQNSWDFRTAAVVNSFFDSTMRGLFSMLFGAGMLLFLMNKKETASGASVAELYYRRLLWLVLFGVINAYVLLWPGDILYTYGLLGMLLYPFRNSSPRLLLTMALIFSLFAFGKGMYNYSETRTTRMGYVAAVKAEKAGQKLTPEQIGAKEEWLEIEKSQKPDREKVKENIEEMRGSYSGIFTWLMPFNSQSETWWLHAWATYDCLFMMFIGMALFKLGFFNNRFKTSTYAVLLLIGYGMGMVVGLVQVKAQIQAAQNFGLYLDSYRVPHDALFDIRRLLLSMGHASLLILVYRSNIVPWLMKALASVGQMAFTNYLMQSIICTLFFYGYGFGYYNTLRFHQVYYVVFAVWVFQLLFSTIWLYYFRFGPFEWLWRSLTYWKKQPMKLGNAATVSGV
jgi:uncharacterized protein